MTSDQPLRHNRDFVLLWSGSAVSIAGSTASTVAVPLLVLAVTGSAGSAGLAGFAALLPMLVLPVPAGVLVDRYDRKKLMLWCDVVRGVGAASIVTALLLGCLTVTQIVLVGLVEGSLSVVHELAGHAAVPNLVPDGRLTEALSMAEARERGATMVGTPLGGVLFGLARALPFLFDAVSYLVSAVTLLLIRKDFQRPAATDPEQPREPALPQLAAGFRWLWRQPFLRTAALAVAGSNLLFRALFLAVLVLSRTLGASPAAIGVLLGVAGGGGLLGSLAASWCQRRLPLRTVVIGANWLWALLALGIAVTHNLYLLGALYALMWFVGPIWNVAVATQQLRTTPDRLQGRVLGASALLSGGALPLGSLAGGLLLQYAGTATTLAVLAGWMVLLAAGVTLAAPVRRAGDPQPRSDGAQPGSTQPGSPPPDSTKAETPHALPTPN
ncbi:MFS transporter [Streptomyces tateyamensis]|uniref:MFS transporter n=1 Tax=Streptomyces tateyamensis TaxID=565073 RepID=UPI001FE4AE3E|nr:MFS transporter [Streptomyces tateyamensis]